MNCNQVIKKAGAPCVHRPVSQTWGRIRTTIHGNSPKQVAEVDACNKTETAAAERGGVQQIS